MTPEKLWDMSTTEFNLWRRENDLKNLFDHFEKHLPKFSDWLKKYEFTIEFILSTDKPGSFFYWKTEALLIESENEKSASKKFLFIPIEDAVHKKRLSEISSEEGEKKYTFKPYLLWAKEELKSDKIIPSNFASLDTFRFVLVSPPDIPSKSRTSIAPSFQVLKLGGVKLNGWGQVLHRNLDFVDLDYLEVDGDFKWANEAEIFYSSCRHIKFNNSDVSFTTFYACHFEKILSENTKFYCAEFVECDIFSANFTDCKLINTFINKCSVAGLSFNRVEVDNLRFEPPKKEWHAGLGYSYERAIDNYKRLRVLFQNNGHRRESAEAYYKERFYELKFNIESLELKKAILAVFKNRLAIDGNYLKENISKTLRIAGGWLSYLVWGFGERPGRTILFSLFILMFYSAVYYFSNVSSLDHDFTNSVYLSSIMFSTLGFGDYDPIKEGSFKLVLASEALIGAFTWGLFIAGYANKAKY